MLKPSGLALLLIASLTLAACGDKKPGGQVVATVGKEEITAIDLGNELGNFTTQDPKVRKAAEQRALANIVNRKILAQAARKAKIDKTPEFAQQEVRVREALMVQVWQGQIVKAVPTPARDEADQFIAQHPEIYADRKLLSGQQLRTPMLPRPLVEQMRPLTTLAQIEQVLTANKVPFQRSDFTFDPANSPPQLAQQLAKLPLGEVFVIPDAKGLIFSQASTATPAPFGGPQAIQHATLMLRNQRTQEAIQRQFQGLVKDGQSTVQYAKGYGPPAPPPKAPAAQAAPAPAAK